MNPTRTSSFFNAGGTLNRDAPSYVQRSADEELYRQVMAKQYCYVLTSRQMGKSSLMVRTAERIHKEGVQTAVIDLSGLGTQITTEQWYLGIITSISSQLHLTTNPEQWWNTHSALGPVQRFTDFIEIVMFQEITEQVVIFIDEIDSTLALDFTDDFFAAIRVLFNSRASNPEYERLTFVLLGVAAPSDLIKDRNRTPFNIGRAINLGGFSFENAAPLREGLEQIFPGQGQLLLQRVFDWSSGHPYLTQKICLALAESPQTEWSIEQVDTLVHHLFFSEAAEPDSNVQFIHNYIAKRPERRKLLLLYRQVYKGKAVVDDEQSLIHNRLKLVGLVRSERGELQVQNQIYRRAFDLAWVKTTMPPNWPLIITAASILISTLAIGAIIYFSLSGAEQQRVATIENLANLCEGGVPQVAHERFFGKPLEEQRDIFAVRIESVGDEHMLITTISCLYPAIPEHISDTTDQQMLEQTMCSTLSRIHSPSAQEVYQQSGCQDYE